MHRALSPSDADTMPLPIDGPDGLAAMAGGVMPRGDGVAWHRPDAVPADLREQWSALAGRTAEANVFAEPWMVEAGLSHTNEGRNAALAFVHDAGGRLIGVVPIACLRGFGRAPIRVAATWGHPNAFLNCLLVARGQETGFWLRLIPAIRQSLCRAPILTIDGLPCGGALHLGLVEACRQLSLPLAQEGAVTRAMLASEGDAETYWNDSVRAKKRKELRRQWARLNEQGVLTTDHLTSDGNAAAWIDEFLVLEASGWKGANGSALSSNPDTDRFFRSAMLAAHAAGQLELTALRIDGRAIAMLITLMSGGAGFSFKTAFDEDFARFSPGVLLQRESLSILTERRLDWIDSCAAQDHPMIDSLWRERRTVLSLALPLPGTANRLTFTAAQTAKAAWHAIKRMRNAAPAQPNPRPDPHDTPPTGSAPTGPVQDDDA